MLREIRNFLNREKLYAALLVSVLVTYSFYFLLSEKEEIQSPAMERIKAAEARFREEGGEQEFMARFLKENPNVAVFVGLSFLLVILFIGLGILLSIVFLLQRLLGNVIFRNICTQDNVSWSVADIAKVIILFLFISIIIGIVCGSINDYIFDGTKDNLFMIIHTTITDILVLGLIIYWIAGTYKDSLKTIGLNVAHVVQDVIIGFSSYCVILPYLVGVIVVLTYIVHIFQYEPPPHPLVDIFIVEDKQNPYLIYFSIFLACILGPFIEEVFFRGFCYNAFKKKWGVRAAMILTAAFFALIHNSAFAFLPIFLLGLVLAFLYERRGTLIPSITVHILHNCLFIGYFFILKRVFLDRV